MAAVLKVKKTHRTFATRLDVSPMKVSAYVPTRDNAQPVIDCQPIQGTFPDYHRVIPRGNDKCVTVNRTAFAHLCAGLAAFAGKATLSGTAAARLSFDGDRLRVTCTPRVETGRGAVDIPAAITCDLPLVAPIAQPIDIGFNPAYLADIAKSFDGDQIMLEMADPGSPTIFRTENEHLTVCMPMRV